MNQIRCEPPSPPSTPLSLSLSLATLSLSFILTHYLSIYPLHWCERAQLHIFLTRAIRTLGVTGVLAKMRCIDIEGICSGIKVGVCKGSPKGAVEGARRTEPNLSWHEFEHTRLWGFIRVRKHRKLLRGRVTTPPNIVKEI